MKIILQTAVLLMLSFNSVAVEKCFGNEPFWSAEILDDKISFDNKDIFEEYVDLPFTSISGAAGYTEGFLKVYSNESDRVAVMTSNKCSDGMSDYTYDNEIIIFTKFATLYGCCGKSKLNEGHERN